MESDMDYRDGEIVVGINDGQEDQHIVWHCRYLLDTPGIITYNDLRVWLFPPLRCGVLISSKNLSGLVRIRPTFLSQL
jgi:hypothetical protein